jgi:hypothetical protein
MIVSAQQREPPVQLKKMRIDEWPAYHTIASHQKGRVIRLPEAIAIFTAMRRFTINKFSNESYPENEYEYTKCAVIPFSSEI